MRCSAARRSGAEARPGAAPHGLRRFRLLGGAVVGISLALWAASLPLRCPVPAAQVAAFSLVAGAVLGAALAGVTRTRRPALIYLLLLAAASTLVPIALGWPPAAQYLVHPPPSAPLIVYNYFDVLRACTYLLGAPLPFALLGFHSADPPPQPPRLTDAERDLDRDP